MLKQFLQFVNDNRLFDRSHSLLAAVSGGADSSVMLHLLAQGRFKVSVAHCNFKLRGADADADEQFVSQLAEKYGMPFFSISFDTTAYAAEHKISIEMAARELRYNWFAQLSAEHGFDRILTAHHLDDNVETMILNICRGTGINGLAGISIVNSSIVRPLLFASRQQIEDYAAANGLAFRTDATNLTDDYQRNIVRHRIVPVMRQINPAFDERMLKNFSNIKQAAQIYNWYIDKAKSEVLQTDGNRTIINIGMLMRQPFAEPVLYECVSEFGFNSSQAEQMMKIIGQKSGFTFSSATHKLLIDRNQIIIESLKDDDFQPVSISQPQDLPDLGITMQLVPASDFQIDRCPSVACLDFDKLQFPLTLRRWQNGDSFYPLGMNRAKKLSDFFIDNKIDLFEKEKTLVLVSAGKIAWIVGMRPDNRFKVDEKTKQVLVIVSQPVRKP
ncbi:MAG: tRNA lysidine(34) synthetase TilS [Salinivirgaceae bacterium]|nr:tRNA lysidine(34) synthetase TilS [Salinivirgaceae bacterium]